MRGVFHVEHPKMGTVGSVEVSGTAPVFCGKLQHLPK